MTRSDPFHARAHANGEYGEEVHFLHSEHPPTDDDGHDFEAEGRRRFGEDA